MKKFLIFILVFVIVAVNGYGIYYYFLKPDQVCVEDVVGDDAIFYVKAAKVKDNIDRFASTRLWKQIESVDYEFLMKNTGISSQQMAIINLIVLQLSSKETQQILKAFFNKEAALVVYPLDFDLSQIKEFSTQGIAEIIEKFFSGFTIVTRLGPEAKIIPFISGFFEKIGADIETDEEQYNGHEVYKIRIASFGLEIFHTRINDLLVIGIGEESVKRSLDIYDGNEISLAQSLQFQKAREKFHSDLDVETYLNFGEIVGLMKNQAKEAITLLRSQVKKDVNENKDSAFAKVTSQNIDKAESQLNEVFDKFIGFEIFAASTKWEDLYESRFYVFFNKNKLSKEMVKNYSCPASENRTLEFVPRDVLAYQWANCLNLKDIWEQFNKEMAKIPNAQDQRGQLAAVEQMIGLSVENDVVPAFGAEFGGFLKGIKLGEKFPVPELLFFIEEASRSKVEKILDQLTDNPLIMVREEEYSGVSFKFVLSPLGDVLEPSYCFLDRYLLIASNKQLLKDAINVYKEQAASLESSPDFERVNQGLTDHNRAIQFVKFGALVNEMKTVIEWANNMSYSQDEKQLAFRHGAQLRLNDVKKSIDDANQEIQKLENDIVLLDDEIWNMESKGEDTSFTQLKLKEAKEKIEEKKNKLKLAFEQKKELTDTIEGYKQRTVDPALRRTYLDEFIYPVLKGFESIRACGMRATINQEEEVVSSELFIDIIE